MAKPGDVIDLSSLGVRLTFLVTSEQTNGELLRVEVVLPPGFSIAEHVHPQQEEQHQVMSGTLRARVGGQEQDYQAGQRVIGPPDVPHAWCNPSDRESLHLVSGHRPVLHMQLMLEAVSQIRVTLLPTKRVRSSMCCVQPCCSTRSKRTSTSPDGRGDRS